LSRLSVSALALALLLPGQARAADGRRIAVGATLFGSGYVASVFLGAIASDSVKEAPFLYVPVVGPLVFLGSCRDCSTVGVAILLGDFALQAGGLALMISGMRADRTIAVAPRVSRTSALLALTITL
jgi:hypothetical protein